MRGVQTGIDPGTISAFYIFVIAGFIVALGLAFAGIMAREKDPKAARFYFIAAAITGGVALALLGFAFVFGSNSP